MTPVKYNLPTGYKGDTYQFPTFQILSNVSEPVTELESGKDYLIEEYATGDFTTVGASENKTGIIFTATGTVAFTGVVREVIAYTDLTDAVIKMQFYKGTTLAFEIPAFTMIDVAKGHFSPNDLIITDNCTFTYDLQVTFASGVVKTYYKGTLSIQKDVTQ